MKSVADFVGKTRDSFLSAAKSSQPLPPRPYALEILRRRTPHWVPPRM